jgi:hypothetical protein
MKRLIFRCDEQEQQLIKELADLEGLGEISNAIRLALREALEKRGIAVPANAFTKKQEGRPKESQRPMLEGALA